MDADTYRRTENLLRSILQPGETVLWQGKPQRSAYIWSAYPVLFFGIFFFGFSIFWTVMAWSGTHHEHGPGMLFPLFGVPFMAIGFYMMIGQFIYRSLEWRNVLYVVTNKRLISLSGLFGLRHLTRFLDTISSVEVRTGWLDRRGETGSLVFDGAQFGPFNGQRGYANTGSVFLAVPEAPQVLHIIQQARERIVQERGKTDGEARAG